MKKHAIIPVFISHRGCPNDCVFCNQKRITAREGDVTPEDVGNIIEQWLTTLGGVETVEVSFYGGSFTGLPMEEQTAFLKVAKEYKDAGRIDAIHLSTRPDYISRDILDNLKAFSVDVIELGVQSFDDKVLTASGRGHNAACVYEACELIKSYGFTLGIQLMIGLPGDSLESCVYSAGEAVRIGPALARLYPTVTLHDTALYDMYLAGEYVPLDEETAVERTTAMYEILDNAGISIIRVGLKSSDIIGEEIGFHPAFRQLVEGRIARKRIEKEIIDFLDEACPEWEYFGSSAGTEDLNSFRAKLRIIANEKSFGNIFGHKAVNRSYFEIKYPMLEFTHGKDYEEGLDLRDNEYVVREDFMF